MRFCKTTTDEGTMTRRNLIKRSNTVLVRNFVKTLAKPTVTSIESIRQAAREMAIK